MELNLLDILHREHYLDLLIKIQNREYYAQRKLQEIFDDNDLEYFNGIYL